MSEAITKTTGEPMSVAKNHHIWLEKVAFFARVIAEHPDFESGPIHKAACELESQADELRTILQDQPAPSPQPAVPVVSDEMEAFEKLCVEKGLVAVSYGIRSEPSNLPLLREFWLAGIALRPADHPDTLRCIKARNDLNAALHGGGALIDDLEHAVANACAKLRRPAVEPMTEADTVQVYGVKNGQQTLIGTAPIPPRMKARELAREQFGHFDDDDGSDADLCFCALEQLIEHIERTANHGITAKAEGGA